MTKEKATLCAQFMRGCGITIEKDFFCLTGSELYNLGRVRRVFRYNYIGDGTKCPDRRFYESVKSSLGL